MTDFLNKIYSIDNIIIYLVIAIAILVVLFVVILLTGKKDQKLEETKRLEALNKDLGVDNAFKEENKQPEVVETTPMPEKYPDILIQSDSTPVPEAPAVPVASVVPETPQMPVVEEPAVDMPIEEVEEKTVTIPFEAVNEAPILVKQEEKPLVFNEEAVSPVITSEPVIQSVEPTSISIPAEPEIVSPAPISVEPVSEPVAEPFVQFDKPVSNMPQINVVDSFKIDPVVSEPVQEESVIPEANESVREEIPAVSNDVDIMSYLKPQTEPNNEFDFSKSILTPEEPVSTPSPLPEVFYGVKSPSNQKVAPAEIQSSPVMEINDLPSLPSDEEEDLELPLLKANDDTQKTVMPDFSAIPNETYNIK